jgi:predicted transcriptional regulator
MKMGRKKSIGSSRKRPRTALSADRSRSGSRAAGATASGTPLSELAGPQWTFLTNHGHVLVLLSRNPSLVLREVALRVGITERAVQRIIADLETSGFIEREKIGRQNHYRFRADRPLRHPNESHRTIGDLLALLNGSKRALRQLVPSDR